VSGEQVLLAAWVVHLLLVVVVLIVVGIVGIVVVGLQSERAGA
jgi:hypothetical protein